MSSKFNYDSFGNAIEGTDYCTGIETYAQNLIEDNSNDASITFPSSNGWATPRTEEYKLTSDNAQLILPIKIYKIKSVKINTNIAMVNPGESTYNIFLSEFQNEKGEHLESIDVSSYVVATEVYNTLKTVTSLNCNTESLNKRNTLYYEDNKIIIAGEKTNWWTDTINWQKAFYCALLYKTNKQGYYCDEKQVGGEIKRIYLESAIKDGVIFNTTDPRQLQFRVEYIPMSTNTKIRARKRASGNVEYIQPINQRAEINSASALGKFLYSTAQKTGTEQITLVKWYTKIKDIPRLGCRVKHNGEHYILTANTFEMTNCVQIKVTHTLSKNWSNKSQYVSVDQKYRNYKIPADILWRNLYWEDFIEITTDGAVAEAVPGSLISSVISEGKTLTPILPRIFMCDSTNDVTITSFFICKSSDGTGATAPCTTMGMANSMIFSASMKDNLSAGLQIDPENSDYCKEVFYCNENGTLNNAYIVLSTGIQNQDSEKYPAASLLTYGDYNNPQDTIFLHEYHIDKDKGEALKFTYQCHWTSREDNIVIGSKLAENHPLIKEWTEDRKFKFWVLKQPLRQGTDKVYANASESVLITTDYERKLNYFGIGDIATPTTVKAFKVELLGIALAAVKRSETKAWAITDENNNLYVGCNDTAKTVLYFTHIHKRK